MAGLLTMIRNNWIIITAVLLAIITLLSLIPMPNHIAVSGSDKIEHFIAYAALMFAIALRQPKYWQWIAVLLIGWSAVIELIQPYFNHQCDLMDMVANGSGVLCGIAIALFINWIFPVPAKDE